MITNAQVEDTVEYKCIAQNPTISSSAVDERTIKVIIKSRNGKVLQHFQTIFQIFFNSGAYPVPPC